MSMNVNVVDRSVRCAALSRRKVKPEGLDGGW